MSPPVKTVFGLQPQAISNVAVRHPRLTIGCFFIVLLLCLPGLFSIELKLGGDALVTDDNLSRLADREIGEQFNLGEEVVIYLERRNGESVLNRDTLSLVAELTEAVSRIPGFDIRQVYSLATEGRDRVDSFNYAPFLVPIPETKRELQALRADIEAGRIVAGTLIGRDYSGASVIVSLQQDMSRPQLLDQLSRIAAQHQDDMHQLHLVGAPVAENRLGDHILRDLAYMMPLAVLAVAAILWLVFQHSGVVALCFSEVLACLAFTFGLYGWSGESIYLTTSVLPIILMSMGLIDEVHLFSWYRSAQAEGIATSKLFNARSFNRLAVAIAMTSVTTALGFLAFVSADLVSLRAMGIWAAVGIFFCMFWSLMFIPAVLTLKPIKLGKRRFTLVELLSAFSRKMASGCGIRKSQYTLIVSATVALLFLGLVQLEVQDGWVRGFAKTSPFYQSMQKVNSALLGTHILRIRVSFPDNGQDIPPFHQADIIEAFDRFEERLRQLPSVGGVLGPAVHLRVAKHLADGRPDGRYELPTDPINIRQMWRKIDLGRGEHRRREVVNDTLTTAMVNIYLKEANYRDTGLIIETAKGFHESVLKPMQGKMTFGGDVYKSQNMISRLVSSQITSVMLAIGGIFVCMCFITCHPMPAAVLTLPSIFACVASLAIMGWLSIPLGIATSMFIAVCLGVGVDFSIHYFYQRDALLKQTVVFAILVDCLIMLLGFGILLFSTVPANTQLGLVLMSAVTVAAVVTVFVMQALQTETQQKNTDFLEITARP
ncbi:MMPL family transporter [Exilibacterium tricleocarpae]|uniref:MMPL family transporter n=1 Tax=Exilibacterium tricleocarpae TaxID=2591008 RepID=A0A545U9L2_9GAMM|nr:MMPL family transporter [Exilibacterium tricleocarpae]TQV86158.1 MMPL family transporter [Exilibacterium tricleocarpae]